MDIAFDTETHLFGPGNMAPKVVCLTAHVLTDPGPTIHTAEEGCAWVGDVLENYDVTLIGQNVAYDFACLVANHGLDLELVFQAHEEGRVLDTKHLERLMHIARGTMGPADLAFLAKKYLGVEMDKDTWRLRYAELDGVPFSEWPQGALDYAMGDARDTMRVFAAQKQKCLEWDLWDAILPELQRQTAYAFAMHLMGVWGVTCDPDQAKALDSIAEGQVESLSEGLVDDGLLAPKKDGTYSKNMKAVKALIIESYPGEAPTTDKGNLKTDANTIGKCNDPLLGDLLARDKLVKLRSTYYSKLMEPLIHPRWNVLGAESGRTSCSGPNLQNQPRGGDARSCIVAPPGKVLIACDYDTQELRTLAQCLLRIVGHSSLAVKFQKDKNFDPHSEFALTAFGSSNEEWRQRAKAGNFGFPGGMGAAAFMSYAAGYGVSMTLQEAEDLRDAWFQQWPEMRDYFRHVAMVSDHSGAMTHIGSGRVHGGVGYTNVANGYFQGLASEASKTALLKVSGECYCDRDSPLYGYRPVLFIHDEIIIEGPEEGAHLAARRLVGRMIEAQEMWTPDIPAAASASAMRRWNKEAGKPVYDRNGHLIPWEDRDQ